MKTEKFFSKYIKFVKVCAHSNWLVSLLVVGLFVAVVIVTTTTMTTAVASVPLNVNGDYFSAVMVATTSMAHGNVDWPIIGRKGFISNLNSTFRGLVNLHWNCRVIKFRKRG